MNNFVLQDLLQNFSFELYAILEEFRKHAGWAGYFPEDDALKPFTSQLTHPCTQKYGAYVTIWHTRYHDITIEEMIRILEYDKVITLKILGYCNNKNIQALRMDLPELYFSSDVPHVMLSWEKTANVHAVNAVPFKAIPAAAPLPQEVQMRLHVIMHNSREMNLGMLQARLKELAAKRQSEIGSHINKAVLKSLNQMFGEHKYSERVWGILKQKAAAANIEFDEDEAMLYGQYVLYAKEPIPTFRPLPKPVKTEKKQNEKHPS